MAIVLMALGPIGPAVLTVNSITIQSPEQIQLSNLTLSSTLGLFPNTSEDRASERAEVVLRMETLENYTFGYRTAEERMLIPWPQPGLESREGAIRYSTDIVTYNYDCAWHALHPKDFIIHLERGFPDHEFTVDGHQWGVRTQNDTFTSINPLDPEMVIPLISTNISTLAVNSTAGFLFFEGLALINETLPLPPTAWAERSRLGLNLVPSNPLTFLVNGGKEVVLRASTLLCEPHPGPSIGDVLLERGTLSLIQWQHPGVPIGNLPNHAANVIFSQALFTAIEPAPASGQFLSDHAIPLFLDPSDGGVLELENISTNLNFYLQSAAKAYLSGAVTEDSGGKPSRRWIIRNATSDHQRPALVTSQPFLMTLLAVVILTTLLLSTSLIMMELNDIRLFDLHALTIKDPTNATHY